MLQMMIAVLARLIALLAGWLVALVLALVVGAWFGTPELPVFFTTGGIWTCLLLLQ
jgi:hypothetical protein